MKTQLMNLNLPLGIIMKTKCDIINLQQNTPEWLDFRHNKIGASDAPIIMGVSPYKKVQQLFEEKYNKINLTQEHYGMKVGKELEPIALSLLNSKLNCNLAPTVVQSCDYPYLIASLDGYDPVNNIACEIKVPCEKDHQLAKSGNVPAKYYPQLQHQMFVAGLQSIVYCSYRDLDIVTVTVTSDLEYQQELLAKEKLFYKSLCQGVLDESFVPHIADNPTIDALFAELQALRAEKKSLLTPLEEKEEALKSAIVALTNNTALSTSTCAIKKVTRTTYDYKQLIKDHGLDNIDLTPYKKESSYWDIKERKT